MKSFDEILDFAIANEQKAHDLYVEIAEQSRRPGMRKALMEFAAEEIKHREKLEAVKAGERPHLSVEKVETLGIAERLIEIEPGSGMNYQGALLFAMKAEQHAYELYTGLANATDDPALRELFNGLAQEELKHKLHFEREYDEVVLEGI
ncbi:MAG: ferritin family protein [Acidobacteria bacterium]|nr:ferritin family protein [Acidobacteriota bacterium]